MTTCPAGSGEYDDVRPDALAHILGVVRVVAFDTIGSTLDVAHDLAMHGAPSGTLVLADSQTAGRGRGGKHWVSEAGDGIWLTLLERDLDAGSIELLALRLGLAAAGVLEQFSDVPLQVKWPNDVYAHGRKLSGILVEARWREGEPEWVAIGIGVNVRPSPLVPNAAGLREGTARLTVLEALVPSMRAAVRKRGELEAAECDELARRDMALGREIDGPGAGTVEGVSASGELLVRNIAGVVDRYRAGSLVFRGES